MSRLEGIAGLIKEVDLSKSVSVEHRSFVGPEKSLEAIRELELIISELGRVDIISLYERSVAFDGVHEEDIYHSGRYYAYLRFELRGQTPEDKAAGLVAAYPDFSAKFGKERLLSYFPNVIKGRQVTENLVIRPDNDDYPSYFSKTRSAYAERMAIVEVPKAVLDRVRSEEDGILDRHDWTTVHMVGEAQGGELAELCGNVYILPKDAAERIKPWQALWKELTSQGADRYYDVAICLDGAYPADDNNPAGRYYAFVQASLKGNAKEERRSLLQAALANGVGKAIPMEKALDLFPEVLDGDPITKPLTIRPDNDEYPSYYNQRKLGQAMERVRNQVFINLEARIIEAAEEGLGSIRKIIILS